MSMAFYCVKLCTQHCFVCLGMLLMMVLRVLESLKVERG